MQIWAFLVSVVVAQEGKCYLRNRVQATEPPKPQAPAPPSIPIQPQGAPVVQAPPPPPPPPPKHEPPSPVQAPLRQPPPKPEPVEPAPASRGDSVRDDCLSTFNSARQRENGAKPLVWDDSLANAAISSASYCANVRQSHTAVVGSQIIFRTVLSCSGGIQGWFFNEKSWNGLHYQIIKNQGNSKVGCAVVRSGAGCISCNFT